MAYETMSLHDWLDDLCVRFIINLPREELESVERICFQIEEAQWFYEDFIRPLDPTLPSMNLKTFSLCIFQHCPLLSQFSLYHHSAAFSEFLAYKTRVPVRGAILLNDAMDQVVLVKGWKKGANWSFPRGKINKDEPDLDCAIREVYEETGLDVGLAGLVRSESEVKFIDVPMREQNVRLYVFRGVSMDTHFEPKTRKEISKIDWYRLADLPTFKKNKKAKESSNKISIKDSKFYMVAPFLGPLKKWINQQRRNDAAKMASKLNSISAQIEQQGAETDLTAGEEEEGADLIAKELQMNSNVVSTVTDEPLNNNMNRLLSQLRSSADCSETLSFPTGQHTIKSSKNAADDLKRLLSVGTPSQNTINSIPDAGNPNSKLLLSMLRGSATETTGVKANETQMLDSKSQQVMSSINQNESRFNIPQGGIADHIQPVHNSVPRQISMINNHASLPPNHTLSTQSRTTIANANKEQPLQTHLTAQRLNQPNRYESDSLFSHLPNYSFNDSHKAPPASKLPPPTLNSHTMKLLHTLRQPNIATTHPVSQSIMQEEPVHDPIVVSDHHSLLPNNNTRQELVPQLGSGPALQAPQAADSSRLLDILKNNQNSKNEPVVTQANSSQREKLLGLFGASKPSPASIPSALPYDWQNIPHSTMQQAKIQKHTASTPFVSPVGYSPSNPHHEISPHRQDRAPIITATSHLAPQKTSESLHKPIQILKRPQAVDYKKVADLHSHNASTRKPSILVQEKQANYVSMSQAKTASQPVELNGSQVHESKVSDNVCSPRRHQQRQPRPEPNQNKQKTEAGTKTNQMPFLDRRDQVTTEHKNNLLSLFSKPPPFDAVSATPAASETRSRKTNSGQEEKLRNSDAQLNSATQSPISRNNASTPKLNDKPSASPVDRQFLLGYLEGVVKSGK